MSGREPVARGPMLPANLPLRSSTDAAPFRCPHDPEPDDTLEKVDHERAARVVAGVVRVVAELAAAGD